ncbi:alpha/beta hydrolase [uncultured Psychroserpens sp.]|uniref:alpha/beta fold hydrolase n=1 Tax=uncultured Psychroserpens sp. TaxID=255436 RepID=UPI002630E3C1|nr:alpha/beta hydrolase [uncultured Psychroserpens sp.]
MILEYKSNPIFYSDVGSGQPVILLHGFLENSSMWENHIPVWSKRNRIISIDLLGHGQTDCIGYIHTMEDMAEAVYTVIKHLKINNATFIGHSMGGYVALALAEQYPTLFKGICLMNSTFESDSVERKTIRKRAIVMAKENYEGLVRMSFANLFAPSSRIRFKLEYEQALQQALKTPVQGYIAAQEGMQLRPNRFHTLKSLECKKLLIIGKKDTLIDGEKLVSKTDDSDIEFVEFSEGHMSHIENMKELTYKINHFIE